MDKVYLVVEGEGVFLLDGRSLPMRAGDVLVLAAAFLSFLFSVSLWFGFFGAPDHDAGQFVGLWVPSILGVGIYFAIRSQRR